MRRMLSTVGGFVVEAFKGCGDVAWEIDVYSATVVIPCNGHAQEESAGPVGGDFMELL
jgi:hypothetical protein